MPQNRPKLQLQNMPQYSGTVSASSRGLVAGFTGSTNDAVLLWSGTNDATTQLVPGDIAITNSATLGTSVAITRSGVYVVTLSLVVNVSGTPTIVAAITTQTTNLATDPSFANGAIVLGQVVTTTADDRSTITLSTTFNVGTTGLANPIRFMASNGAGAAPAADSLVIADCSYSINRVDAA